MGFKQGLVLYERDVLRQVHYVYHLYKNASLGRAISPGVARP